MTTEKSTIRRLCSNFTDLPILVIGDLILDHYIWGDAYRISPEAPVPVVRVDSDSYSAGGAANVALNLKSLGSKPLLGGVLGRDDSASKLVAILEEAGVALSNSLVHREVATILKTRVVVRQQQLCRLDREEQPAAYSMEGDEVYAALDASLDEVKAVIVSDYAKGVVTEGLIRHLVAEGRRRGLIVGVDPKPSRPIDLSGAGLMTPNRIESLALAGLPIDAHAPFPAEIVCERIYQRYAPQYLIVTLGAEGMLLSEKGKVVQLMPTYAREVYDVSGAGDTVIAALTLSLAAGATLEEAAHLANTAAGVVVAKLGTATANIEEILQYEKHLMSKLA